MKPRLAIYLATWGAAFLSIAPTFKALPLVPFLPLGFAAVANIKKPMFWGILVLGWIIYLVHACFIFNSRTNLRFWLLWVMLVFLLGFNVVGCRRMLPNLSSIL